MLDNCICGHKIIPGDSQYTAVCALLPVLNEVHMSTHEEKIELKQPSFPLSHIVIGFHLRAGSTLLLPLLNFG